jgi:imidazolonepropionase-like amidohydrolase
LLNGAPAPVRELELYEEAGADPVMLLEIGSRNGASWLGEDERLGLVEEGFEADLLVLDGDPFVLGAAAFRQLRHVISKGTLVNQETTGERVRAE